MNARFFRKLAVYSCVFHMGMFCVSAVEAQVNVTEQRVSGIVRATFDRFFTDCPQAESANCEESGVSENSFTGECNASLAGNTSSGSGSVNLVNTPSGFVLTANASGRVRGVEDEGQLECVGTVLDAFLSGLYIFVIDSPAVVSFSATFPPNNRECNSEFGPGSPITRFELIGPGGNRIFDEETFQSGSISLPPGEYGIDMVMDLEALGFRGFCETRADWRFELNVTADCDKAQSKAGTLTWVNPAGGTFDTSNNWTPARLPTVSDNLAFTQLTNSYVVDYTSIASSTLLLDRGLLRLRGNGLSTIVLDNAASCEPENPTLALDSQVPGAAFASLVVEGGTVETNRVVIGSGMATGAPEPSLALVAPTAMSTQDLIIGNAPDATQTSTVFLTLPEGQAPQEGLAASLECKSVLSVGNLSPGELITDGGTIDAGKSSGTIIGFSEGVTGTVEMDAGTANFGKVLDVGFTGNGILNLSNGAVGQAEEAVLAGAVTATAAVSIDAGVSDNPVPVTERSRLSIANDLILGDEGNAILSLLDGATLDAKRLTIAQGSTSDAELNVLGADLQDPSLGANLSILGPIVVGEAGTGRLVASDPNGAYVCDGLIIGAGGDKTNLVSINGGVAEFGSVVTVGFAGAAENTLALSGGATASVSLMTLGESLQTRGSLILDGADSAVQMRVKGQGANPEGEGVPLQPALVVGRDGHGRVELIDDARLETPNCEIGDGSFPDGLGEVVLKGEDGVPVLVADELAVGVNTNGLLALLGSAGGVQCKGVALIGGIENSGGTVNLANLAVMECNSTNVGFIGPGLVRIGALASWIGATVNIDQSGLFLVERGAQLNTAITINNGRLRVLERLNIPGAKNRLPKQADTPARISGRLELSEGGTLDIEVAASPMLVVEGGASLGGTLNLLLTPGATYTVGQTLGMLQIEGDIAGAFGSINVPNATPEFAATTTLDAGVVTLTVTQSGSGTALPDTGSPLEGEGEESVDGEGNPEGDLEGQTDGETQEEGEGEGERDEVATGCNGCSGDGGTNLKGIGDWMTAIIGLAVLVGAHMKMYPSVGRGA